MRSCVKIENTVEPAGCNIHARRTCPLDFTQQVLQPGTAEHWNTPEHLTLNRCSGVPGFSTCHFTLSARAKFDVNFGILSGNQTKRK